MWCLFVYSEFCHHRNVLTLQHFHQPKRKVYPLAVTSYSPWCSQAPFILEPTVCKLVCSSIHVNGIMHHSHFWFLLLSVMLSWHIHVITSNRNSFLIWLNNIFSHKPHFAFLSVCGRLECLFSTVRWLLIKLPCMFILKAFLWTVLPFDSPFEHFSI